MLSDALISAFNLRYRSFRDDYDTCSDIVTERFRNGDPDIPPPVHGGMVPWETLHEVHAWIAQQYLDHGAAHLVEADLLANIDSQQDAEISGTPRTALDLLTAAGHTRGAARIWRAHVAGQVDAFWYFHRHWIKCEKYTALSEDERIALAKLKRLKTPDRYERAMAADMPKRRDLASATIAAYRAWLAEQGLAERDAEQLATWEREITDGKKTKLPAPDKRPMDEDLFWTIIADTLDVAGPEALRAIEDQLSGFTAKAIRDFATLLRTRLAESYRTDLWALAYLLMDGASDDAFEAFRNWLILQGRDTYDTTLEAPDDFDISRHPSSGAEWALGLMDAVEAAYTRRASTPLKHPKPKPLTLAGPDVTEDAFATLLPGIARRVAAA